MLRKIIANYDYILMLLVLVIFAIGMVTISSATAYDINGLTREMKFQMIGFVIGIVAMTMLIFIDYRWYGYIHWIIYALSIGMLLLLYIPGVGVIRGGALSWIDLGSFDFQTSEISKIGYIIFLSKFVADRGGIKSLVDALLAGSTVIPLFYLLIKQPDLGTALVFLAIAVGIIFVSGIKYWHIGLLSSIMVVTLPFVYNRLNDYQKERILAFMNQDDLTLKGNYHVMMSKISVGSGRAEGKGLYQGVFHKLDYLPVKESDFIFSVYVEEWGFRGGIVLLGLYFCLLLKLLYNAFRTHDVFGSNLIVGILFMFGFQVLENIGMTMGVMPVTGLTLPFFSAGPTSLVSSMIALGLVHSVLIFQEKKVSHDA